ncbi:AAA family ATPase [Dactylosporangium sp. CS-033363]|uniref:AAA family ATPase n=1 Tax=Dactylosporangium sp. CS-033363 TaxID=3239935 RepID=UPI003D89C6A4
MNDQLDEDILRRHFIAIATGTYDDPSWKPLPVEREVEVIRSWMCGDGLGDRRFTSTLPELAGDPTEDQVRAGLKHLATKRQWTAADAAVVYITGHGESADDTHYLILRETQRDMLHSTALRTADLIGWLADTAVESLLVIVDACYAGKVAADVLRLDKHKKKRWLLLPSATRNQTAVAGALTEAIAAFLADLRAPEGRRYGEGRYLDVGVFVQDVGAKLAERGFDQNLLPLYGSQLTGPHVCLPNPHHRDADSVPIAAARHELALPRGDLATHWSPRARGVATDDEPGWLFAGRAVLMRALISAVTGDPGAVVVTGGAGCGKSAALARLVTLTDDQFLADFQEDIKAIPGDLVPPAGSVDCAVVATGKLHTQVIAQICAALRVPPPTTTHAEPTVEERLEAWHNWLRDQRQPVTIIVDALDEAAEPQALVREVLARLEIDHLRPRIRLLVGVRSLAAGNDSAGTPATATGTAAFAEATETLLRARRIAVDQPPWWDQADLAAYVAGILAHSEGSPYPAAAPGSIPAIAAALSGRSGRSFLVARIAASSLVANKTIIDPDDDQWLAALDAGVVGVFRDDLHRSLREPIERYRAVILLRAVAFAYGAGLPWRDIWPLVAHAVDDDGAYYGDSDIAWLLTSRLGAYLVTDTEDGVTVYRLFHDLLRTTLRERWRELLDPPERSPGAGGSR